MDKSVITQVAYYTPNQPFIKATEVLEEVEQRCSGGQQYTTFPNQISDEEIAKIEALGYIVTKNYVHDENRDGAEPSELYIGFQVALTEDAAAKAMVISEAETNGIDASYTKAETDALLAGKADLDSDGLIPTSQIPPEVFERMIVVQDDAARFALTTDDVQNGDLVYVNADEVMYYVYDDTKLDTEAGYKLFVAGIAAKAIADKDGNDITTTYVKQVDEYNAGKTVQAGTSVSVRGTTYTVGTGAERFNNYSANYAVGDYSHAEGAGTIAVGNYSHAEGGSAAAWGVNSHAEGAGTNANGAGSHAEGGGSTASGDQSHAEGGGTRASGSNSHAEGGGTTASNSCSHAEGGGSVASGSSSHAEGAGTNASGSNSHAEGQGSVAIGNQSHAEGNNTNASSDDQHVEGKYNVIDSNGKFAHIIGNGTSANARSNAFAIDWEGKIYVNNAPTGVDVSILDTIKNKSSYNNNDIHLDTAPHLASSMWYTKTWNGISGTLNGDYIWTDGNDIYYSYNDKQYVLDKTTSTWSTKTWSGSTNINGSNIWTDGINIYYSSSTYQYVLRDSYWANMSWSGITNFHGSNIWTDGNSIYYSSGTTQYMFNGGSSWSSKSWNGLTNFYGSYIWTDGNNIYYSSGNDQYVLDKATSTWSTKTWKGLTYIYGNDLWTDGKDIYYSTYYNQYVLDKATSTWSTKTWYSPIRFYARGMWTDGDNIYYSSGSDQYVLNTNPIHTKYKPILGTASRLNVPKSGNASSTEVVKGDDTRLTDSRTPLAHNQASDTINAMTGYAKAQADSSIATSDTLNEAVGKLEYKADVNKTNISSLQTLTQGIDNTGDDFIEINGKKLYFSTTTPSNPSDGDWWLD